MNARVGVIGLGHWGKNIVRNLNDLGVLAALHDASAETRENFARQYPDAQMMESKEAFFADDTLEGVMIATPAVTHGDLVDRALAAGRHVFVEKPICLDVAEAELLAARAADAGRLLMVGHLLHYHPAFVALREAVLAGELGRLRYIYSNRAALGKIRREENALWSFAPHDISMILALAGRMPERVVANGGAYLAEGVADTTLSHLKFGDGLQGHIFVSWLHPYKDQRLVVVGERGMAVFNDVATGDDKLLLYRHSVGWDGDIPFVNNAEATPIPYAAGEPLRRECEVFLAALAGRETPPTDAEEAIDVLRVLGACEQSLMSGSAVDLLAGEERGS